MNYLDLVPLVVSPVPLLKVKLWMSDRPSNQWLYLESPTEKSPGPFLRRVPWSQGGMEPAG